MQQTLCIIKPDSVKNNDIGGIINMIESDGFKVAAIKMLQITPQQARLFYEVHSHRPFFQELVDFMISSPAVVLVLQAVNAVTKFRDLIGHTNPLLAQDGTIRKKYGASIETNSVHGSDSDENAKKEIAFFFNPSEIVF